MLGPYRVVHLHAIDQACRPDPDVRVRETALRHVQAPPREAQLHFRTDPRRKPV